MRLMRIALLLLIAANLLAFAWGQGWLAPIVGDVRQPGRMDRQVDPDRLRILDQSGLAARARTAAANQSESSRRATPAGGSGTGPSKPVTRPRNGAQTDAPKVAATASTRDEARKSGTDSPDRGEMNGRTSERDNESGRTPTQSGRSHDVTPGETGRTGPEELLAAAGAIGSTGPGVEAATPAGSQGSAGVDAARGPENMETGQWPVAAAPRVCFDLRGLEQVRADAIQAELKSARRLDVEERDPDNRSGYIIYVPAAATFEQAQARVEALRAQGISDLYLIPTGSYRLAVSLGVFNQMEAVERRLAELRARGVEDAQYGFVAPSATRVTLRVSGPADAVDEARLRALAAPGGARVVPCP